MRRAVYLQHRVGLQEAVLDCLHLLTGGTGDGVVLQHLLGGLRLPSTALARDENALVLPFRAHRAVGIIRHSIAERRQRDPSEDQIRVS